MTGHLNPLSAVIENKCGASLAVLTHNPITVLAEPTGPFALFQPLTLLLLLCLSPRLSREQRGVPKLIDPVFLTHTIQLSWTLVPFKPPSWNPLFCVPDAVRHIQMSTQRCRHGDPVGEGHEMPLHHYGTKQGPFFFFFFLFFTPARSTCIRDLIL